MYFAGLGLTDSGSLLNLLDLEFALRSYDSPPSFCALLFEEDKGGTSSSSIALNLDIRMFLTEISLLVLSSDFYLDPDD